MPKKVVSDVFGELLETGKATAKAGTKAAGDIAKGTVKSALGQKQSTSQQPATPRSLPSSRPKSQDSMDWLERGASRQKAAAEAKQKEQMEDQRREEQIDRLKEMDDKRSVQAYKQIQDQIRMIQKKKASQPRKYVTAATEFDDEQVKDPESYFDKMKKKKEEMKNKFLPWTKKKGMGTGEIRRGASG